MPHPQHDPEYSTGILLVPVNSCPHPDKYVVFRAMKVISPENALVDVHCFQCLGHWNSFDTMPDAVFSIVEKRFNDGRWTASDPDLEDTMKFRLAQHRNFAT